MLAPTLLAAMPRLPTARRQSLATGAPLALLQTLRGPPPAWLATRALGALPCQRPACLAPFPMQGRPTAPCAALGTMGAALPSPPPAALDPALWAPAPRLACTATMAPPLLCPPRPAQLATAAPASLAQCPRSAQLGPTPMLAPRPAPPALGASLATPLALTPQPCALAAMPLWAFTAPLAARTRTGSPAQWASCAWAATWLPRAASLALWL